MKNPIRTISIIHDRNDIVIYREDNYKIYPLTEKRKTIFESIAKQYPAEYEKHSTIIHIELCQDYPYFDRFDICEAYYVLEVDYNISGVLQERRSNHRSFKVGDRVYIGHSTDAQLHRMQFKPSPMLSYDTLSDNGKAIYDCLVKEYGLNT